MSMAPPRQTGIKLVETEAFVTDYVLRFNVSSVQMYVDVAGIPYTFFIFN